MTRTKLMLGLGCLAGALMVAGSAARSAELVVVDTKGTRLRPGQVVDGAAPLKLETGQQVTLVGADGRTVKLRGPSQVAPDPSAPAEAAGVVDSLRNLVQNRAAGTGSLAVVRSAGDVVPLPEPWLVDVSRPGDRCLMENTPAVFWRSEAAQPAQLEVRPADSSWQAKANWPATQKLAMPPTLPLRDGESYMVQLHGSTAKLTFHIIPSTASKPAMQAAWMVEKGCDAQATALVSTIK
jgi:hypothetical protein